MHNFRLHDSDDVILWKFEKSGKFSVKSLYNALTSDDSGPFHKNIWKGKVPQNIKIFIWLLTNNAILTKDNHLKRKWSGSPSCAFCNQDENANHLFFTCPVAKVVWAVITRVLGANNIPTSIAQCWKWCEHWLPHGGKFHMWGLSGRTVMQHVLKENLSKVQLR